MKALTSLPTSSYLRIAEQAKVPLAELLELVPALESGLLPAYVARYRPDISAGLDTEHLYEVLQLLHSFLDLEDRRITVLASLGQKNQLSPELRAQIEASTERQVLEDLYLPFRNRRPSTADRALEQGLEPLANLLWDQDPANADMEIIAGEYVDPHKDIPDVQAALANAVHIVARRLADDSETRGELRKICIKYTELHINDGGSHRTDTASRKKTDWLKDYKSPVTEVGWRQHLALRFGMREGLLKSEFVLPEDRILSFMLEKFLKDQSSLFRSHFENATRVAYHDYLATPLRDDVSRWLADRSDTEALRVFKKNLRKTLLSPPAGTLQTIGLEIGKPGGWRAAVVGGTGNLLATAIVDNETEEIGKLEGATDTHSQTTEAKPEAEDLDTKREATLESNEGVETTEAENNPDTSENVPSENHPPDPEKPGSPQADFDNEPKKQEPSQDKANLPLKTPHGSLGDLIREHNVEALVFARRPGAKQNEKIIRKAIRQAGAPDVIRTSVNETGNWIYATSRTARKELPDVEPAVRSAISLARRFQDPLVELVKLDPRLLGIGQFHTEIEPHKLRNELNQTVEACVNEVGVDLNHASQELLEKLPGATERLAKRIVEYRNKRGGFSSREQLKEVPGMNARLYNQLVGFVRINGGENLLDATGVHPNWYPTVEKIISAANISMEEALGKPETLSSVDLKKFETVQIPRAILEAIIRDIENPKRDPRDKFEVQRSEIKLLPLEKLKPGLETSGLVTDITDFGLFVDIGADQEGLVHISQIADQFRKDGKISLKSGDHLPVRVLAVDNDSGRISLTTLDHDAAVSRRNGKLPRRRDGRGGSDRSNKGKRRPRQERRNSTRSFGPDRASQDQKTSQISKLSIEEKFSLLETKYRTKI